MYEVIWSVTYGTNKKIITLKIDDIYIKTDRKNNNTTQQKI